MFMGSLLPDLTCIVLGLRPLTHMISCMCDITKMMELWNIRNCSNTSTMLVSIKRRLVQADKVLCESVLQAIYKWLWVQSFRLRPQCGANVHVAQKRCVYQCNLKKGHGRPTKGTTRLKGYGVSSGRPVGITAGEEYGVSPGRRDWHVSTVK